VKLTGTANSTVPGATYSGPFMGAPNLSTALAGQTAFDATAVGKPATLSVVVMASDLVTLPLATLLGVPAVTGNLDLKVTGGTVTAVYTAVCASDGKYSGTVVTSGTVTLGGALDVSVPLIGDMSFPLPALSMQLPALTSAVNLTSTKDPMGLGCASPGDLGGVNPDGGMTPVDGMLPVDGGGPGTATVSVAGQQMTVGEIEVWPTDAGGYSTDNQGHYSVFIDFSGSGWPSGSMTAIDLFQTSTICTTDSFPNQQMWLNDASGDQYESSNGAGCGLSVTVGSGTVSGTFNGIVTDSISSSTVALAVSFNVALP
jgi:hypothetical protein